jgi:hypothetical protein
MDVRTSHAGNSLCRQEVNSYIGAILEGRFRKEDPRGESD